jgi:hypothetical protein
MLFHEVLSGRRRDARYEGKAKARGIAFITAE